MIGVGNKLKSINFRYKYSKVKKINVKIIMCFYVRVGKDQRHPFAGVLILYVAGDKSERKRKYTEHC